MALSWPTAAGSVPAGENIEVGFAELPGSKRVYHVGKQKWEARAAEDDPHVPLLSVAGRIGVVRDESAHRQAAFRLLLWLSGKQFSRQVCASSPATTLFRRGHLKSPQKWVEVPVSPVAARQYGSVTEAALQREQWLAAPRIPGRPEYLSVLDEAVHRAVGDEQSATEALGQAAAHWRKITLRLGKERQKTAYRHSLGLE